jgi:predicted ATPase
MYLGDFAAARGYLEQGLLLYEPVQRASQAELAPGDTFISMTALLVSVLASSGHLDQARSQCHAMLSEARRMGHAFSLTYGLYFVCHSGWLVRADPADLLQVADEMLALSNEGGFAYWRGLGLVARGWCLSRSRRTEEGIPLIATGLAELRATGTMVNSPNTLIRVADAFNAAGQPEAALAHLAEALRLADATQIRWGQADMLRLRGDLLMLTGDCIAAEASFQDAIALARGQTAKLFELRSATSLARLWRDQGKIADAQALLAPVYNWFTEGFDAPDLVEAKALLHELA